MATKPRKNNNKELRRTNGEGTIYFDEKKDRWLVAVTVGYDKNGRQIRKTARCLTKAEAVKRKEEILAKYQDVTDIDAEKMTVASYLDHYLDVYKKNIVRENTYKSYLNAAHSVKKVLGNIRLCKLTVMHVKAMMNDLSSTPRAASYALTLLRMACRRGLEDGLLRLEPTAHIKKPTTGKSKTVITTAEAQKLVNTASGINKICIQIAYATGMRSEEVLGLYWKNIDFSKHTIRVDHVIIRGATGQAVLAPPKNKSSYRTITIPSKLVTDLQNWKQQQTIEILAAKEYDNKHFVVTNEQGFPMTSNTFSQRFKHIANRANINITMRGLRHSHATQLFSAGWHPKDVQERLGHSNISTTMDIYTAYIPTRATDIAAYMDKIYPQ